MLFISGKKEKKRKACINHKKESGSEESLSPTLNKEGHENREILSSRLTISYKNQKIKSRGFMKKCLLLLMLTSCGYISWPEQEIDEDDAVPGHIFVGSVEDAREWIKNRVKNE